MNYYKKSLKEFKRVLKKNKKITKEEWDKYAHENCLFSAFTLEAHADAENFEDLKKGITPKLRQYVKIRDIEKLYIS